MFNEIEMYILFALISKMPIINCKATEVASRNLMKEGLVLGIPGFGLTLTEPGRKTVQKILYYTNNEM